MTYPKTPSDRIQGVIYFPRMLDKIRLHARGELGPDYTEHLGSGFDGRCCNFLGISYEALKEKVLAGAGDEEALAWAFENGTKPSEEMIGVWGEFMRKRGWRDSGTEILERRKKQSGLEHRDDVDTMFGYIDADEGR